MAALINYEAEKDCFQILKLTKSEAVDLIGLLAAQAAGVGFPRQMSGACPEVRVEEEGTTPRRLVFIVE